MRGSEAGHRATVAPGSVEVLVKRLDPELPLPTRAHPGDAGWDLVAARDVTLGPGERQLVPTGLAIALPDGYVALVHPRSGLAARHGVTLLNAPGTIDAGYRGEIQVVLHNADPAGTVQLRRGDRIAQLLVQQLPAVRLVEAELLPGADRGENGFGSTGGWAAAGAGTGRPGRAERTVSGNPPEEGERS